MKRVIITGASKGLGKAIKEILTFTWAGQQTYIVQDFSRTSGVDLTKEIPDFECDVLILNAGVWNNDFELNYHVPKKMAYMAMEKGVKHLIFVLSNAANKNFGNDDYTTSKAGLKLLAERLFEEGRQKGIKVSCIYPGAIDTSFWKDAPVDNRRRGAINPNVVADSIYHIIKTGEDGACIKDLVIMPELKQC